MIIDSLACRFKPEWLLEHNVYF